eukprot:5492645-Alexandrium_andersonii.AAC.1
MQLRRHLRLSEPQNCKGHSRQRTTDEQRGPAQGVQREQRCRRSHVLPPPPAPASDNVRADSHCGH